MRTPVQAALPGILTLLLLSCTLGAALTPPATATPTFEPTVAPLASATPTLLANLPPDTPVPSATVDPNSPEYWACKIRSQVPRDGAKFESKERFDVAWQVENFGYGSWEPETVRVTYFSGTRMQVNDLVKLKASVPIRYVDTVRGADGGAAFLGQLHHGLGAVVRRQGLLPHAVVNHGEVSTASRCADC